MRTKKYPIILSSLFILVFSNYSFSHISIKTYQSISKERKKEIYQRKDIILTQVFLHIASKQPQTLITSISALSPQLLASNKINGCTLPRSADKTRNHLIRIVEGIGKEKNPKNSVGLFLDLQIKKPWIDEAYQLIKKSSKKKAHIDLSNDIQKQLTVYKNLRNEIILQYQRYVLSFIRKHFPADLSKDDLFQEGMLAAMEAFDILDIRKDNDLIAVLNGKLRKRFNQEIQGRKLIRVPDSYPEYWERINSILTATTTTPGTMDIQHLSTETGLDIHTIRLVLQHRKSLISTSSERKDKSGNSLVFQIAASIQTQDNTELFKEIRSVLSKMSLEEQLLINSQFSVTEAGLQHKDIARIIKTSTNTVVSRKKNALKKMEKLLLANEKVYLGLMESSGSLVHPKKVEQIKAQKEAYHLIKKCIQKMSSEEQMFINSKLAFHKSSLSNKEIAQSLGVGVNTVVTRKNNAFNTFVDTLFKGTMDERVKRELIAILKPLLKKNSLIKLPSF